MLRYAESVLAGLVPPRPASRRQSGFEGSRAAWQTSHSRFYLVARGGSPVEARCRLLLVAASIVEGPLEASLRKLNSELILRSGPTLKVVQLLITESRASAVFWNRGHEPVVIARGATIENALRSTGVEVESFNAALLHKPWTIQNQGGRPFQMFTPFWTHYLSLDEPAERRPSPNRLPRKKKWPESIRLAELELKPKTNWIVGIKAPWQPGENGEKSRLRYFLAEAVPQYDVNRNRPNLLGTSPLSPHLHFGEISSRQILHAVKRSAESRGIPANAWQG